jgi:putative heme-binding domain-containing protein
VKTLVVFCLASAAWCQATNPLAGNEKAATAGRELFNRTCTACHGMNGTAGDRAPALGAGRTYNIRTDEGIFNAIRDGIPGSAMPRSNMEPTEIWKIVAYIRSLRATASDAFVAGDAAAGERVFWEKGKCGNCHMIRGRGGISGPDLSNAGGERTLAALREALTKPRLQIPRGYRPVEVTTADGRKIAGIAKNENNFSFQILDSNDRLQLFTIDELADVTYKPKSLMPSNYDKTLSASEFQNLLSFLSRQVVFKRESRRRRSEDQ